MEGLTWGAIAAVLVLCTSLCSVASFYFGRRKAATEDAKEEGSLKTDIKYIKDSMRDTSKTLESLSIKLDAQDKQREDDYRQLLVQLTELKSSYKSLHIRVDELQRRIDEYHRN